jgi:hypothetical protein
MAALARAGGTPVFVFFYSGHGGRTESGGEKREAALTLLDGPLSQRALHEEILDKVRASLVHVVIDACHAEALVRSRDVEAQTVEIPPPEMAARLAQMAAIRFPQMGVVISSRSDAPAHEWDVYQSGVFTHEVISGLRGAADVNGDGRVEYSEMGAFLTAANREVVDPRARVRAIVQPPAINPHAPLIRIGSGTKNAWLTGIPSSAGQFYVEDGRGNRIVDGHAERGFAMSVAVPANEPLFVRDNNQEADLILRAGDRRPFELLEFHPRPVRTRGAVESSLRAGLFAMPYGPSYYSGYVDQRDAVAVVGVTREAPSVVPPRTAPATNPIVSWSLRGAAGALLVSATVFAGLAWDARSDFEQTSMQRQAAEASDRYKLDRTLALSFLISGAACAVASYLVGRAH